MASALSDYFFLILLLTMIVAGGLGGTVNHFFAEADQTKSVFGRAMLVGIVASLMVPLFLNMISSNLLDQIRGSASQAGDPVKLLVFAGFCLIAAVSSRAFIKTLSDRVLREIEEAKKDAADAKRTAKEIEETVTEPEADSQRSPTLESTTGPSQTTAPVSVSADEKRLLEAFARSKYVLRTSTGLATQAGIEPARAEALLVGLANKGLVETRIRQSGPKWQITHRGDEALAGS